jgi:hypothetical protein
MESSFLDSNLLVSPRTSGFLDKSFNNNERNEGKRELMARVINHTAKDKFKAIILSTLLQSLSKPLAALKNVHF